MKRRAGPPRRRVAGAALLAALITVALVAVFAGQSFWQQWRSIEVETAERNRLQASWLLGGTLDWARARLRDNGLRGALVDHAAEAWAQPVTDLPLAEFLAGSGAEPARAAAPVANPPQALAPPAVTAVGSGLAGGSAPAFDAQVSLQLQDAQGKLNVLNLLEGQALSPTWLRAFDKLFALLNLPPEQLATLTANLQRAHAALTASGTDNTAATAATAALLPQQTAQLVWLGLEPATLAALSSHVTLLPSRTPVNLNSASLEVLQALVPRFTRLDAQRLVALRQMKPLTSLGDAGLGAVGEGQFSVNSRFFELHLGLRLGPTQWIENALLQRDGADVRTLWRRRGTDASPLLWPNEADAEASAQAGLVAAPATTRPP